METTDPAYEAGLLAKWLHEIGPSDQPTYKLLSDRLGVGIDNPAYLELMAAASTRMERLGWLATTVASRAFSEKSSREAVAAATNLRSVFHPQQQAAAWNHTRANYVRTDDMFALALFSPFAKALRPLRVVAESDRDALLQDIERAVVQFESGTPPEGDWIQAQVVLALKRLALILRYFQFFGHDFAVEQIQATSAAVSTAARVQPDLTKRLGGIAAILLTAVAVFKLPLDLKDGARFYYDTYLENVRPALLAFQQHLLIEGPRTEPHTAPPAAEDEAPATADGGEASP